MVCIPLDASCSIVWFMENGFILSEGGGGIQSGPDACARADISSEVEGVESVEGSSAGER